MSHGVPEQCSQTQQSRKITEFCVARCIIDRKTAPLPSFSEERPSSSSTSLSNAPVPALIYSGKLFRLTFSKTSTNISTSGSPVMWHWSFTESLCFLYQQRLGAEHVSLIFAISWSILFSFSLQCRDSKVLQPRS